MERIDPEAARRESVGAFVHEIRTPLTAIRMVLEMARRGPGDEGMVLDGELAEMMQNAVGDIQKLADAMQEMSRLERGGALPVGGRTPMEDVIAGVRAAIEDRFVLNGEVVPGIEGSWDVGRLTTALCGMAEAANRCGAGDGVVRLRSLKGAEGCELRFESGQPGGAAKAINADLGYSFYRGYALIRAMKGDVAVERESGHLLVAVRLPG